jgi:hypothetical protein
VFISYFEVFIYLALMQSGGSSRVQTGRIGYGFKHAGPNQFDLLEEIGSGRVNLYVDFFKFKIDFDWIISYLISDWVGSG